MQRVFFLFIIFLSLVSQAQEQQTKRTIPQHINKLLLTESMISRFYVDSVNEAKIVEEGIKAMLKNLDPHSTYSDAKEVKVLQEALQGNFEGIGVQFNMANDTVVVIQPTLNGPSEKVGILPGDRIVSVNDTIIAGKKMERADIMRKLRGPRGTAAKLGVVRRGIKNIIYFDVIRDKIATTTVDASYMVDKKTGYIRINSFGANTHSEFVSKLDSLKRQGMEDIIIDLQGNGGGYLQAAVDIANEFLSPTNLIVYTEGRVFPRYDYLAQGGGKFGKGRVAVLIDESSASAAEILAGAIQDWDRGMVIGRRSFGKGLVQRSFDLPDGSMIRLTIARYYTPSGRNIQRPYSDSIPYRQDFMKRISSGELMHADSIHFPDSLKYNTKRLNRTVYGGGGIMPDFFVPLDTSKYTKYHRDLARKGSVIQATLHYLDDNRAALNAKYPNFELYKQSFEVPQELLTMLRKQAQRDSVELKGGESEYEMSLPQIRLQLKALLARDLWDMSEYFEIINSDDRTMKQAVELMKHRDIDALLLGDKKNKKIGKSKK